MWPRIYLEDLRIVCHYLGKLLLVVALAMCLPMIVGLIAQDYAISINYLIGIAITVASAIILCLVKVSPSILRRKQAVIITAIAWFACSLFAAIPLFLSGHFDSFFDSYFEAVSGFTTTGFTMLRDIEHLSMADNVWRFILQYIGGQGVLVIALSFGAFAKGGGSASLYDAEGRHDHVLPDIKQTASFIWRFSIVVVAIGSIILTVVLLIKGMHVPDAIFNGVCMTIGTYDTGGFCTTSLGILYYHCWPLEFITMFIMVLGAINFSLYNRMRRGHVTEFFKNIEVRTFAIWILIVTVFLMIVVCLGSQMNDIDTLLRKMLFTVISATTNTGFQVITANQLTNVVGSGVFFMIAISMTIGGMSESTSGGIKMLRLGIVFKTVAMRIKQVLAPESANMVASYTSTSGGRRIVSQEVASTALVIVFLYFASYIIGAVIGLACGYDAVSAIFESISATSNAGFTSGVVGAGMPFVLKVTYLLQMILGRLEFITVLALIISIIVTVAPRRKHKRDHRREFKREQKRSKKVNANG